MFTVNVGSLYPGVVLIKIVYVAELLVDGENIVFSLPGSVAPWILEAAMEKTVQVQLYVVTCKYIGAVHTQKYCYSHNQMPLFNYWP